MVVPAVSVMAPAMATVRRTPKRVSKLRHKNVPDRYTTEVHNINSP